MPCIWSFVLVALVVLHHLADFAAGAGPATHTAGPSGKSPTPSSQRSSTRREIAWQTDYAKAMQVAVRERKLLFIVFRPSGQDPLGAKLEAGPLADPEVARRLQGVVPLRLPVDARIELEGRQIEVLKHAAFAELNGKPGLAVVDLATTDRKLYGRVTRTVSLAGGRLCTAQQVIWLLGGLRDGLVQPASAVAEPRRLEPWALEADRAGLKAAGPKRVPRKAAGGQPARLDAPDAEPAGAMPDRPDGLSWYTSYAEAATAARKQGRMMLILFRRPGRCPLSERFEAEVLGEPAIRTRLASFVRLKLPLDATLTVDGHEVELIKQDQFAEMLELPGLAVVDFEHKQAKYYGQVVSVFPFLGERLYTVDEVREILELPPGTLTQRTLIYAVRTHPEQPASARGELHPVLLEEAESHAEYQARIGLQGHHFWESRFHRISARLPGGLWASEVCAESWPGQHLLESAIECVRCWRLSPGHWEAVRTKHPFFGYDMKRGTNGVWYATGIFGRN